MSSGSSGTWGWGFLERTPFISLMRSLSIVTATGSSGAPSTGRGWSTSVAPSMLNWPASSEPSFFCSYLRPFKTLVSPSRSMASPGLSTIAFAYRRAGVRQRSPCRRRSTIVLKRR